MASFDEFGSGCRKTIASKFHIYVNLLGVVLATSGFAVVWVSKAQAGEPNFQSSHSVIGFIAVLLCWIQFLSGLAKAFGAWHLKKLFIHFCVFDSSSE